MTAGRECKISMMSGTVDMNSEKLSGKPFFRIGEVSAITKVSISDLRMWEAEFGGIRPKLTSSGLRLYRKNDIERILEIRHLVYEQKLGFQDVRQILPVSEVREEKMQGVIEEIREELREELLKIRELLMPS